MIQYSIVGTTAFLPGGYAALSESSFFIILFWGFVIAFAVKAGLFPVHIWLPEAHPVAPSPASALLSGMVIKTGVFGIFRMTLETFGVCNLVGEPSVMILLIIAIFTMFWGSAIAIGQLHIKRMLAYSSVSQMGYIVIGSIITHISSFNSKIFIVYVCGYNDPPN
jgi:multicomponent Na+:H+ antiporter subunit D